MEKMRNKKERKLILEGGEMISAWDITSAQGNDQLGANLHIAQQGKKLLKYISSFRRLLFVT